MNLNDAIFHIDRHTRIGTNKKVKLKFYVKELFKINPDKKISKNLIDNLSYLRTSELVHRIDILVKHQNESHCMVRIRNTCCIVCGDDINETDSFVCSLKCFDNWVRLNTRIKK